MTRDFDIDGIALCFLFGSNFEPDEQFILQLKLDGLVDGETQCVICQYLYEPKQKVTYITLCLHPFHQACFEELSDRSFNVGVFPKCPLDNMVIFSTFNLSIPNGVRESEEEDETEEHEEEQEVELQQLPLPTIVEVICGVCLSLIGNGMLKATLLCCGAEYHYECIDEIKGRQQCVVCHSVLEGQEDEELFILTFVDIEENLIAPVQAGGVAEDIGVVHEGWAAQPRVAFEVETTDDEWP